MKTLVIFLGLALLPLASSTSEARGLDWCEAQRIVEMRNAVLDASLLCKSVVTPEIYNTFIIKNRSRIKDANEVAVRYHMKKYGSRKNFDKLDSFVMNRNSQRASVNRPWFCGRMKIIADQMQTMNIVELLAKQTELEVPTCK